MYKSYAGIGSRSTPLLLKPTIKEIVEILNEKDYILRSGGAPGADSFFEEFAKEKEIFIPWPKFNGSTSERTSVCKKALKLAKKFHPAWDHVGDVGRQLMARNSYQILGEDLKTPVDFVICWTPNGAEKGGTAQAIRIAKYLHIPIFNLFETQKVLRHFQRVYGTVDYD